MDDADWDEKELRSLRQEDGFPYCARDWARVRRNGWVKCMLCNKDISKAHLCTEKHLRNIRRGGFSNIVFNHSQDKWIEVDDEASTNVDVTDIPTHVSTTLPREIAKVGPCDELVHVILTLDSFEDSFPSRKHVIGEHEEHLLYISQESDASLSVTYDDNISVYEIHLFANTKASMDIAERMGVDFVNIIYAQYRRFLERLAPPQLADPIPSASSSHERRHIPSIPPFGDMRIPTTPPVGPRFYPYTKIQPPPPRPRKK